MAVEERGCFGWKNIKLVEPERYWVVSVCMRVCVCVCVCVYGFDCKYRGYRSERTRVKKQVICEWNLLIRIIENGENWVLLERDGINNIRCVLFSIVELSSCIVFEYRFYSVHVSILNLIGKYIRKMWNSFIKNFIRDLSRVYLICIRIDFSRLVV